MVHGADFAAAEVVRIAAAETTRGRMQASAPTTPLRQLRRISLEIAGLALVDDGDAVGAGVGADNAAELEHDQRCMASSSRLAVLDV